MNASADGSRDTVLEFTPPFCPNPDCCHHVNRGEWRWKKGGVWSRKSDQQRFRRYRCQTCGRSFSLVTFTPTYWLRRRDLFLPIAQLSVSCASLRRIGVLLGVSHTTVARHLGRLGRQAMLFHRRQIHGRAVDEEIPFDGFEAFEFSQFFPFHLNISAGRNSWFIYHFTDSPLRRKGRMTIEQKTRREELESVYGRPDPKAVEKGVAELLATTFEANSGDVIAHSDDHQAYPRAIRRWLRGRLHAPQIQHLITPSSVPRTINNPLFAVNLADLLIRHTGANHKRETIAFSRRRQAAIERMAVFVVWRNYIKPRREKRPARTPAMAAGIEEKPWRWRNIFSMRLFPTKIPLPERWKQYYRGLIRTPVYPQHAIHNCRYAF